MKIYLYLKNKILTFSIPQKISGSFSFDENPEEESKLINIEAKDSEWYLYSTTDVSVISGGTPSNSTILKHDNFYILERNNIRYLIYASKLFDNSFLPYLYRNDINLIIGNDSSCNVDFHCQLLNGIAAKVYIKDNKLLLDISSDITYINNIALTTTTYEIKNGDELNIYGLKIIFLNGFLLINNPYKAVKINFDSAKLNPYKLSKGNSPRDIEIKDIDLYRKEEYFSKSPRLRRIIKTKEIDLSPPPKQEGENEIPLILTIGTMLTMGIVSGVRLINIIVKIYSGETTIKQSLTTLITSIAMLLTTLFWPVLTKKFNKKLKAQKKKELIEKYTKYLEEKKKELFTEQQLQKDILKENLISVEECIKIIETSKIKFWDKRIDQNDFLDIRIGTGDALLDVKVNYPEEGFTIEEDELRKKADAMVEEFKYIKDVPIAYSLYKNKITAIMGGKEQNYGMINNIILQLITFYSYEDIKLVIFTNNLKEENWEYIKYLNHSFSNDKNIRFFSSNIETAKILGNYLNSEIQNRIQAMQEGQTLFKPYYIIITDDYSQIKRQSFTKILTELDANIGFSLVILENQMSKLPSKCNNFISLGGTTSGILKNSFDNQEQIKFTNEINYNINMMSIAKKLSNIPIEFEEGNRELPDSITFLEMEKVGKVEQLNIMNRWDMNDATSSLKAEVGVDEEGNLMYLDLHEKFHGPHGLIAGMTGSGKSEFIITYILSMAINYSPDEVSFVLIDYKGGGLAGAFENKATGVTLPHLAGTITNLDKAEMDRTLVSIDSEIKRRQKIFNEARDKLGESTIDIYKYQRFFKEGKISEPVPHLFIICDEFAELKSQQPDFMDNLISVARIGRSLGVHLILATQKPSGVVNDQIWSNTKFRVCLKVQDAQDSKEMLKRPEAASIKQTGRFYLQVGYDEYFALGQSAWCGAKYYPSDKIIKQVDKSVNFINNIGSSIKKIQAGNNLKIEAQGEQLAAIMQNIIKVSKLTNKRSKRLWLNDIEPIILVDNLEKKYDITKEPYKIKVVVGEYDAPEKQEQGVLMYSLNDDGNTVIFGNDEEEREKLVNTIIYSICKNFTAKEVNIYAVDYGSESLRMFNDFPQIGGIVYLGEDEKFKNLFKLINNEIKTRKKLLISYGGSIENYNNKNDKKIPQILFLLNNYEAILEAYNDIYENISSIGRDCERYGISIMITCNTPSTLGRRVSGCFENKYALHLTDPSDYYGVFNSKSKIKPRDILGRGLANNDGVHEFQTASIVEDKHSLNKYINETCQKIKSIDLEVAPRIPSLPEKVTFDIVEKEISDIKKVPIGISKNTLKVVNFDFSTYTATSISSNKLININSFMDSLLEIFIRIKGLTVFFIDTLQLLPEIASKRNNGRVINYFNTNFELVIDKLTEMQRNPDNSKYKILYIFYGLEKLKSKVDPTKIESLFKEVKASENSTMIFCDSTKGFKSLDFDNWYSKIKNNTDGIWVGKGFGEQQNFRVSKLTKEMTSNYSNNYGFCLIESNAELIKLLDFNGTLNQKEDEDEE